ncbi:MAG: hypothetical protein NTW04_04345 [Elusimicrobia bacterium]|nr:hypothetical protein [Elusimicrobiota bacterium]
MNKRVLKGRFFYFGAGTLLMMGLAVLQVKPIKTALLLYTSSECSFIETGDQDDKNDQLYSLPLLSNFNPDCRLFTGIISQGAETFSDRAFQPYKPARAPPLA